MTIDSQNIANKSKQAMIQQGNTDAGIAAELYWGSLVAQSIGSSGSVQYSSPSDPPTKITCRLQALIDYFIALQFCESVSQQNRPDCQQNALDSYNSAMSNCENQ